MSDNKKVVLDHTIKELGKMISSLKSGKIPTFPKSLKQIADIVNVADIKIKENKVNDEELDVVFDKIAKDISEK